MTVDREILSEVPAPPERTYVISEALWFELLTDAGFSDDERMPLTPEEAELEYAEEVAYFRRQRALDPTYGTRQGTEVPR